MKLIEIFEIGSKTVLMKRRVTQGLGLPIMWGSENFRLCLISNPPIPS